MRLHITRLVLLAAFLSSAAARAQNAEPGTGLISVRKIWDAAPHNAFTDLIRFQDRWVCAFREGDTHLGTSVDGRIRVIESNDTENWESAASLSDPRGDIRDAKLSICPDGRLMLLTVVHVRGAKPDRPAYQSVAFFTKDLKQWDGPIDVGEPDVWQWGLKWHKGIGLSIGYGTRSTNRFARLYKTTDGVKFEPIIAKLSITAPYPTESAIAFDSDGAATVLLRCDPDSAFVGRMKPPYTDCPMKQTRTRVGGPALMQLPDGRLLGAARLHDGGVHTALFWLDPIKPAITEWLKLPSRGDTSYAGMVLADGVLNVSYYSTHEGKTSIYFAKVRVPELRK